jgi:hypothetical protein
MGERPGEAGDIGRSSIVIGNALISPLASPLPRSLGERPGERAPADAAGFRSPSREPSVTPTSPRGFWGRWARFTSPEGALAGAVRYPSTCPELSVLPPPLPLIPRFLHSGARGRRSSQEARRRARRGRIVLHAHLCDAFASQIVRRPQHGGSRTCQRSGGAVIVAGPAGFRPPRTAHGCLPRAAGRIPATGRDGGMSCRGTGPASTTLLSLAADLRLGG